VDKKVCTYGDGAIYTPRFHHFALPLVAVEHENREVDYSISYSLWKILSVRASVRVLICYEKNEVQVQKSKQDLECRIKQGEELVRGKDGQNLLVIIGNKKNDDKPFAEFFSVFEWSNKGHKLKSVLA
jgi:hypothetical protein